MTDRDREALAKQLKAVHADAASLRNSYSHDEWYRVADFVLAREAALRAATPSDEATVARLRRQLTEAEADVARLDWLQAAPDDTRPVCDPKRRCWVVFGVAERDDVETPDLRAAIDAAKEKR